MRRPLCVFCVGTLGAELVYAFLPQVERLLPLAAFLLLGGLWGLRRKKERGYVVCLLLGALLGLAIMGGHPGSGPRGCRPPMPTGKSALPPRWSAFPPAIIPAS